MTPDASSATSAMAGFVVLAITLAGLPARADQTIPSVAFVSKNENRNQVHYGVRLKDDCTPAGPTPIFAYWRMLEKGPQATAPILEREQRVYGIENVRVNGTSVQFGIAALPSRPITVRSSRDENGRCVATATTTIGGAPARLVEVRVTAQGWDVSSIDIIGRRDGRTIRERVQR